MSEEIDLSQFDDIADRVERAKAKAAALREARAAGGGTPAQAAEPASAEAPAEDAAPAEAASAGEVEVDLSDLDQITDRVERAKAKAEAIRKARGTAGPSAAPAKKAPAKKAPAKKAASAAERAAAARALTGGEGGGETRIVVQTTPAPPSIRPGPDRIQPLVSPPAGKDLEPEVSRRGLD